MDVQRECSPAAKTTTLAGEANPADAASPVGLIGTRLDGPHRLSTEAAAAPGDAVIKAPTGSGDQVAVPPAPRRWRKPLIMAVAAAAVAIAGYVVVPRVETALNTVSTDDAYVNSHVTFLAPRVPGQVQKVFVDDNYRVRKGYLLVQFDKEPYQVQLAIKQAAMVAAEADLAAANSQVRAYVAAARANRFALKHAIENVGTQIASLRAAVATLNSSQASLDLASANLERGDALEPRGGISKEDLDQRRQTVKVDEATVDQALQQMYAIRVGMGLPAQPPEGKDLTNVSENLARIFLLFVKHSRL